MGIYAPRRAGDVAGAVLVGGADADDVVNVGPRERFVRAVWETISQPSPLSHPKPGEGSGP
jgi:hypothetical protein